MGLEGGNAKARKHHNEECMLRFDTHFDEDDDPKWKTVERGFQQEEDKSVLRDQDGEPVDLDAVLETTKDDEPPIQGDPVPEPPPPTPPLEPDTPLRDDHHFGANPEVTEAMEADQEDEEPFDGFPELVWDQGGDAKMDTGADDMKKLLVSSNATEDVAWPYVQALRQNQQPPESTFVGNSERGGICAAAAREPNLNIKGLASFDLRSDRPGGRSLVFNQKRNRMEARNVFRRLRPVWIIGSPSCSRFSS